MSEQARQRALTALRDAGFDPHTTITHLPLPASNETWLGEDFVLRVGTGDPGKLAREATVAAALPAEARYPGVIAAGQADGFEWLISRRARGEQLSRVWHRLSRAERERAITQLADALRALHETDVSGLPGEEDLEPPHTLPLEPLRSLIEAVRGQGSVEASLCEESAALVRDRWPAFDRLGRGLVHGDAHLENVLWDGRDVTALLDLEWSRRSWLQVDLEILLSFCDHPWLFVAGDYETRAAAEDYVGVPTWLSDAHPAMFAHPRLLDRLILLHVSRTFGLLHQYPPHGPESSADPRDRRNHLRAVLDGSSHLHRSLP